MRRPFNDEHLNRPLIARRLDLESAGLDDMPTGWWAVLTRANGEQIVRRRGMLNPDPVQQMFVRDMATALNRHLRHDGAWIVALTDPAPQLLVVDATAEYQSWLLLWLDEDGDPGFTIDNDEPFWRVLQQGPNHWLAQADAAWDQWHRYMRKVLAPGDGQTFKRAQGEAPPSTRH